MMISMMMNQLKFGDNPYDIINEAFVL